MGIISDWAKGRSNPLLESAEAATFETSAEDLVGGADIDPAVFGLTSYVNPLAVAPRIDRRTAIQVPAVKRCKELIPGVLGSLPVDLVGPDSKADYAALLNQPEKSVPRSVTMARTFEDMYFEGTAWWRIIEFGWHNYPTKVKRLDPRRVSIDEDQGKVYVDGVHVTDDHLIRFDSPTDGLLTAGARAIRTALTLDAAAARYADGSPPADYFEPAEQGVDPFDDDDEVEEFLTGWGKARQQRSTGYVPYGLNYKIGGFNPEQLQLADARQHAVLEIGRAGGVDPEDLGVSVTSRTYFNAFDRRKDRTDFTLGQYRQAFEDRMSMNDVTPGGYVVRMNLDAFLRSDPKTRMETYEIGLRVGAYDGPAEIRELEDKPPLTQPPVPQEPRMIEQQPAAPVQADQAPATRFADDEPEIRLAIEATDGAQFAVDYERRQITGLLVPYGVEGISNGQRFMFSQGTLKYADPKRVKLWIQHDKNRVVGYGVSFDDRPDGMYGTFQVEDGPEGDEALRKADPEGSATWDAFSIGLRPGGKYRRTRDGVNVAVEAPWMETSLTPAPSFDDARVHQVAASATEGDIMDTSTTEVVTEQAPAFDVAPITEAIAAGFAALTPPTREVVSATDGGSFEVTEQPLYRFDGIAGQHSLTEDLRFALMGDNDARGRVDQFFEETFAVTTTNTGALNPTQNRPDLYVPNLAYSRPLWEMVSNGAIVDKTPFTIPQFASASGLVNPHTEGVEPTPGSFAATAQTVTPGAVSGKIEVDREVLDQGGSPQADQIIWGEILNGYYEAIEARIATKLAAVATTEVQLAGAVDGPLVKAFTSLLAGLQFVRGGNRFTALALDGQAFPALVNASDSTGRSLLPVLGPTNAQGETSGAFDRVSIGGLTGRAAWALGSATTSRSYLFVPSSVYAWASAPRRFDFQYQLKSVDIGVWGYGAEAVTRASDVRPIDYTTAD